MIYADTGFHGRAEPLLIDDLGSLGEHSLVLVDRDLGVGIPVGVQPNEFGAGRRGECRAPTHGGGRSRGSIQSHHDAFHLDLPSDFRVILPSDAW